jgi:alpha-beta hydrolase superfamily lysophospholipase
MPASEKERRLLEASQARMGEAETTMLACASVPSAAHFFPPIGEPSGRRYLVVHGWGSRIDYLQTLITGLRQTGAAVVGLDLPGHGRSEGHTLTVPLALETIDAAWRRFDGFDAVIGHSFGGFVSAMLASAPLDHLPPLKPGKLVLIAAPSAAKAVFAGYSKFMGFSPRVRRAMEEQIRLISGRPIEVFAADRMLATHSDLPVLVLHAEDDKEVPPSAARAYASAGPHVRLEWMNGLGHRRIVNSEKVIAAITNFLG